MRIPFGVFLAFAMSSICYAQAATARSSSFLLGADISALASFEQGGAVYRDAGGPDDAIAIFVRHGWNCFRLRIFVNPNGRGGVVNSLEYTRALARRIKAAGASFMLDFHYSDTWADPQHQIKPASWNDLGFDALEAKVEQYTADVISDLRSHDLTPEYVQIGNEITGGALWPDAQVKVPVSDVKVYDGDVRIIQPPEPYDDARQWDRLTRIIMAGLRGVRGATRPADRVQTIIHIDCGGDWPVTRWFLDHLADARVDYDIIGQSYYPHWHGTLDQVRGNLHRTIERYHKPLMIVETAYPWKNRADWETKRNMAWPVSAEGQRQFLADVIDLMREAPDSSGIGVFWWHPESILAGGRGTWNDGAMALFDNDGHALPALDVLSSMVPAR